MTLTIAKHQNQASYWEGGHYELNLSFDTLRDRQWQRLLQVLWNDPAIKGPLAVRYVPGVQTVERVELKVPPPTATLTQHGQLDLSGIVIGCDVQATRSLFECVSVLVPLGMFDGIRGGPQVRQDHVELEMLDQVLYDMALRAYDAAPFKIAVIGYERGCQLPAELHSNAELCKAFVAAGSALAQEEVLRSLKLDVTAYEQARANLRWLPPHTPGKTGT